MQILRLEVEGGFLDELSLEFAPGLNVLIGERGTGKTSVIEVLRYVLEAGTLVAASKTVHEERARSVLGDGIATVTLGGGDSPPVTVSRSYRDETPRGSASLPTATAVGQGEMEAIGVEASSRLRLLDRYSGVNDSSERSAATAALAEVRSQTQQLKRLRSELVQIDDQLERLSTVPEALDEAVREQGRGLASAQATQEQATLLTDLQSRVEILRATQAYLNETWNRLQENRGLLSGTLGNWRSLPGRPDPETDDPAASARTRSDGARDLVSEAIQELDKALETIEAARHTKDDELSSLDGEARAARAELGQLREGLNALARRVEALREQSGTRNALLARRKELIDSISQLGTARRETYSIVDDLRASRLTRRRRVAEHLNQEHGPELRITVSGGADRSPFTSAIIKALTGSGLHYNAISPVLSKALSPLELVECAETLDYERLAAASELPANRCAQILSALAAEDLTTIALSPLEDVVHVELLDGSEYKPMTKLSIGQRCTAILPIVLGAGTDVLIVDQPEDNLDNAFISTTIVPTISARASRSQVIVATHNPNIPVLGTADNVVHMASDGQRGFVVSAEPLGSAQSREAITEIMEGGDKAFMARSEFYGLDDSS